VPEHHFGLEGIRKRAEFAGGRAEIRSAPHEGTVVSVELPNRVAA
jgi:signal transduction histidine kinase